jgi:hypothetical protein
MNDTYIDVYNLIFEVLKKLNTRQRHILITKKSVQLSKDSLKRHRTQQEENTVI